MTAGLVLSSCPITSIQRCSEARTLGTSTLCCGVRGGNPATQRLVRGLNHSTGSSMPSGRVRATQLPLEELQTQLDTAIALEDYEAAAGLRDELSTRRHDNRVGVEEANRRFYAAMRESDLAGMEAIWGFGAHVQCMHPVSNCLAGRQDVMAGWRLFMTGHGKPSRLRVEDVRIHAYDHAAWVTCTEIVEFAESRGRIAATNIFEKQDGQWKIVHHQGADVPRL